MNKILCLTGLVFLFNSSVAFADKDTYFNLSGMVVNSASLDPSTDEGLRLDGGVTDKSGFGFSMALGKKLFKNFRVEAQYARRDVSINVKDKDPVAGLNLAKLSDKAKKMLGAEGQWSSDTTTQRNTKRNEGITTSTVTLSGTFDPTKAGEKNLVFEDEVVYKDSFAPMSAFFDEDNLVVQTIMANGYYDFSGLDDLTPYFGAGIGIGFINLEDESNFAYQLMAGVSYSITDSISSNVGYTFLDAGDVDIDRGGFQVETETKSHSIDLGITYSF